MVPTNWIQCCNIRMPYHRHWIWHLHNLQSATGKLTTLPQSNVSMLKDIIKQGSINYHFWSLWHHSVRYRTHGLIQKRFALTCNLNKDLPAIFAWQNSSLSTLSVLFQCLSILSVCHFSKSITRQSKLGHPSARHAWSSCGAGLGVHFFLCSARVI